jgi:hypothetical protein
MNVSKQILLSGTVNNSINIPINLDWEYLDTETDIVAFQDKAIKELLASDKDFEVNRFAHADFQNSTEINYEFYFYEGSGLSNVNNWKIDYRAEGFTTQEIYYYANSFRNSFFKLDLYDSPLETEQTNYITIIIPTQQGERMDTLMQTTNVFIRKPKFILNYVGDKEGFFIYWLKKRTFLDVSRFYMSAKFFDGKTGQFVRMMNRPQSSVLGNKYNFSQSEYFYYRVDLDYEKRTYQVFDTFNIQPQRVGGLTPIKWYEYINP